MLLSACLVAFAAVPPAAPPPVSDHGDTPLLTSLGRHDARITDLYAFTSGDRLVVCVGMNPAVPVGLTRYLWPSDVTIAIHIDNKSRVSFDDPADLAAYGGTILQPDKIRDRIVFTITADGAGVPRLAATGIPPPVLNQDVRFFAGLRDDPFIRGPRIGRNVAALVIDLPVQRVVHGNHSLLVWATSSIEGRPEPFQDLAGRSLRSMFLANDYMNVETPREHFLLHGVVPDVLIYDPSRPALFPNGRALADDVVDMVGDPGILASDAPFPSANDVPFLAAFPYLAPPHP